MTYSGQGIIDAAKQENLNCNILFKSTLGYWNEALEQLFDIKKHQTAQDKNFNIKIKNWDINFDHFHKNDICDELIDNNGITTLKSDEDYSKESYLYVYIAPITWASKYINEGFQILGPAFGTKNALTLYANKGDYKYQRDKLETRIGTVGQYITSTALLRVYHLFMTEIFKTNIHLICEGEIDNYKNHFRFPPKPNVHNRFISLTKGEIDFAIFTDDDIIELDLTHKNVREILKIDPILAHIFNVDYVPRTVYCIHKSQIPNMRNSLKNLFQLFNANESKFNKPIKLDGQTRNSEIYAINPENCNARDFQKRIIRHYRTIEDSLDLEELQFINLKNIIT